MNVLPPASTRWNIPSRHSWYVPSTLAALLLQTDLLPQLQLLTAVGNPHPCSTSGQPPPLPAVGGEVGAPGWGEAQPDCGMLQEGEKPSTEAELCLLKGAWGIASPQVDASVPLILVP